jgi:hypothetical protein
VLSLEEKLDIITTYTERNFLYYYCREIWNWQITSTDIKKSKHKLEAFKKKSKEIGRLKATAAEQVHIHMSIYIIVGNINSWSNWMNFISPHQITNSGGLKVITLIRCSKFTDDYFQKISKYYFCLLYPETLSQS